MYFATIHTDAALQLGRIASGMGQRAFVGKARARLARPPRGRKEAALAEGKRRRLAEGEEAGGARPARGIAPPGPRDRAAGSVAGGEGEAGEGAGGGGAALRPASSPRGI